MEYLKTPITDTVLDTIKTQVEVMCISNRINKEKQDYHVYIENELLTKVNNSNVFVSGSKKDLSFYGRVYVSAKSNAVESIFCFPKTEEVILNNQESVIILGGIKSSTTVSLDTEVLSFYVAPKHLLAGSDMSKWHKL